MSRHSRWRTQEQRAHGPITVSPRGGEKHGSRLVSLPPLLLDAVSTYATMMKTILRLVGSTIRPVAQDFGAIYVDRASDLMNDLPQELLELRIGGR